MPVDPLPDRAFISVRAGDIGGLAVAIAPGPGLAAVQRVAVTSFQARGEVLAVVVAEAAEGRPTDARRLHQPSGMVEVLAKDGIHAAHHGSRPAHAGPVGRRRVLPREL